MSFSRLMRQDFFSTPSLVVGRAWSRYHYVSSPPAHPPTQLPCNGQTVSDTPPPPDSESGPGRGRIGSRLADRHRCHGGRMRGDQSERQQVGGVISPSHSAVNNKSLGRGANRAGGANRAVCDRRQPVGTAAQ